MISAMPFKSFAFNSIVLIFFVYFSNALAHNDNFKLTENHSIDAKIPFDSVFLI